MKFLEYQVVLMINFCALIVKDKEFKYGNIQLSFIDSFQFLSSSLESLVEKLPKESMIEKINYHKNLNNHKFELLTTKGVFP